VCSQIPTKISCSVGTEVCSGPHEALLPLMASSSSSSSSAGGFGVGAKVNASAGLATIVSGSSSSSPSLTSASSSFIRVKEEAAAGGGGGGGGGVYAMPSLSCSSSASVGGSGSALSVGVVPNSLSSDSMGDFGAEAGEGFRQRVLVANRCYKFHPVGSGGAASASGAAAATNAKKSIDTISFPSCIVSQPGKNDIHIPPKVFKGNCRVLCGC
jgi:hypothetical protein